MSQNFDDAKTSEPKPIKNVYGVNMLGVNFGDKSTKNTTRVSGSNNNVDEPDVILNLVLLQMVSTSKKEPYVHVHNLFESMNVSKEFDSTPIGKIINRVDKPHVEPHLNHMLTNMLSQMLKLLFQHLVNLRLVLLLNPLINKLLILMFFIHI